MNSSIFKIIISLFLAQFSFQFLADQLSAHKYAQTAHDNILQIIRTENALFEEDPDKFKEKISRAFSPIVDFKRISRYVMGRYSKKASIEQIESFSDVFEKSLLDTYTSTLINLKMDR